MSRRTVSVDKIVNLNDVAVGVRQMNETSLAAYQRTQIATLWQAATAYQDKFFSGAVFSQIYQLETMGSPKAKAVHKWIFRLWRLYYSRKDVVEKSTSIDEVMIVSTDFSTIGPPPHSVKELMSEVARLIPDLLS